MGEVFLSFGHFNTREWFPQTWSWTYSCSSLMSAVCCSFSWEATIRASSRAANSCLVLSASSLPAWGEGDSEVEFFFLQICWNARSRTGCFYIPLNWVRTYIFKLLECTKVSELRIYMICISNLIEPRNLQMIIPIWKEVIPSVFPQVQQYASVSPRAVSQGRRSWTLRPQAAASGCSPSGANMNNILWRQT